MTPTEAQHHPFHTQWRFLGLFGLYLVLFLVFLRVMPFSFIEALVIQTTTAVTWIWQALHVPFRQEGPMMYLHGFGMEITLECTAINHLLIAVSGILAYPSHSARYKALGIVVVSSLILLINAARIGVLGLVGHYANDVFEFVHIYLWQGLFAVLTLFLWVLWLRGKQIMSRALVRYVVGGIVAASVSVWVLVKSLPAYAAMLAMAADAAVPILSWIPGMPVAFSTQGSLVVFQHPRGALLFIISVEMLNTVLFWTPLIVMASMTDKMQILKRAVVGFVMLFAFHLALVILNGALLNSENIQEGFNSTTWFTRGVSFAAPLVVWFLMLRWFPSPGEPRPTTGHDSDDSRPPATILEP